MRALIKNTIKKGRTIAYHIEHNNDAKRILKVVEAKKGAFNPKDKKLCIEYAKDVFGNKKYAPWLFVYSAFAKEFKEGWIPNNYYGEHVIPNINGEYGDIGDKNAAISKLVNVSNSLDIAYYVNRLFLSADYEVLNEEKLKKLLFSQNEKVVYKIENSQQGKGIYFFDEKTFNIDAIKKLGNGVFQDYIEQHPFFSEFTTSSVATIRITSVCDDNGEIHPKVGYFRFGRDNDTHVISSSAMKIPIDIKTGKLFEDAYYPNWESTKQLPDKDISFAGKELPLFNECLSEIKKMHSCIPFIRCVGWDVIIDKNNNVRLIELNGGHSGIKFSEAVQGPNFKGLNWGNLHKK